MVPFPRKLDALSRVLDARQPERAIVFCATKRMVDEVVEGLRRAGYSAEALHGDISQVIARARAARVPRRPTEVLVATDVAARGLDVPDVSHVINFDIPPDPEYYVHRIGRTGRFGRSGVAVTFVNPREMRELRFIERVTGAHIRRDELPTAAEVEERETELYQERLRTMLQSEDWHPFREVVQGLMEDYDPVDVAAAAAAIGMARAARSKTYKRVEDKPVDFGTNQWDNRNSGPPQGRPYRAPFGSRPPQGAPQGGGRRPFHRSEGGYRGAAPSGEGRPDRPAFAGTKVPYGTGKARSGKPRPPAKDRKPRKW